MVAAELTTVAPSLAPMPVHSSTPAAVTPTGALAGVNLVQISSGRRATCAQGTTGVFYCWGSNTSGQLGNASTTSSDPARATPSGRVLEMNISGELGSKPAE